MSRSTTSTPVIGTAWLEAVLLVDQLRRGQPLPRLEVHGLPTGEQATLDVDAHYAQWRGSRHEPTRGDEARLVVTDERILVDHPHRGRLSLWHVDLENLQLGLTDEGWHLDLHPVGINPRIRLTGDAAALVAVHVAHAVFPSTWSRLSGLLPLLESAA